MNDVAVRSNDRILLKALALFSDKGYDATSVREICEAAGVTKPTLYHFYGSKEGVYRAIVEGALERFRSDLVSALQEEGPLRERMVRTARAYFAATTQDPDLARFILALIHHPPRSAPETDFLGFYRTVLELFAAIVENAVARGEIAPGPTAVRLLVFMGALGEAVHGHLLVDTIFWGWSPSRPPSP
jgi:AcrR family transcriptional regulator